MPAYPLNNILFLDIETVPQFADYDSCPEDWKKLWDTKTVSLLKYHSEETIETIYNRAGIYAEFGKVICISCGVIGDNGGQKKLTLKSFYGDDEKVLLGGFIEMIKKWSQGEPKWLCAHNGKEFDFPYLCRRMVINNECIPDLLSISGKRPWEVNHLDTMELWRFGDYKNFTSLNLLAHALNIPTSKDDIDGSMVGMVYWKEKNLERIVHYCQKDVVTMAQIFLRLNREPLIKESNIEIK